MFHFSLAEQIRKGFFFKKIVFEKKKYCNKMKKKLQAQEKYRQFPLKTCTIKMKTKLYKYVVFRLQPYKNYNSCSDFLPLTSYISK